MGESSSPSSIIVGDGGMDKEEYAELVATIQGDHVAMKTWYNNEDSSTVKDLKEKYGSTYPTFWRDVLSWKGWKEVRKAYLNRNNDIRSEPSTKRRKKSRWASVSSSSATASATNSSATNEQSSTAKTRKSRWARLGNTNDSSSKPAVCAESAVAAALGTTTTSQPVVLSKEKQQEIGEWQAKLRVANEKLSNLEVEAARVDALPRGHVDRSPSPPPIYDAHGVRKNTRAVRWKERYSTLRQDCLERLFQLQGQNNTTQNLLFSKRKRFKKIYIPVDEHPTYNFIGLIIGPRGKTQKEMEQKTNCKIAIRGKGSIKEGARGRRDGQVMEGDDEPLHVVITGDDATNVDAAADMIQQMLVVIDDDVNVHKQQQLRELALLNGTLKEEDVFCQICAEKGHRAFECPKRFAASSKVQIKCAICGDTSHPTRDCTQNKNKDENSNNEAKNKQELDQDYMCFMAELDGKPPTDATSATITANTTTAPTADSSVITTISTRIISANGETKEIIAENTNNTGPAAAQDSSNTNDAPIDTETAAVATTEGAPAPTVNEIPTVKVVATTPIVPPVATAAVQPQPQPQPPLPPPILPPPTTNTTLPPPPLPYSYYAPPPQQPYYASYPPPQYPPQPQQQQPQQQQPQQHTWDYRSYYGTGTEGGDASGAGGFNWWESGDQNE